MGVGQMWFGTEEWMQWIPAPLSGADMSPQDRNSSGVLANGGGYSTASWGSHKLYIFEWGNAGSREMAQLLKDYSDGTYGRGLIHFIDPLTYDKNIAPARLASPSMAIDSEGASLVYDVDPVRVVNSGWKQNRLPAYAAQYDLGSTASGYRGREDSTFIPVPQGYQLYIGAFYQATGTGGLFYTPVTDGTDGAPVALSPSANTDLNMVPNAIPTGIDGVRVWLGRSSTAASTVTFSGLIARLAPIGTAVNTAGPWSGGTGHSGCRLEGKPTYQAFTGVDGGQVGVAARFREVGSWVYG